MNERKGLGEGELEGGLFEEGEGDDYSKEAILSNIFTKVGRLFEGGGGGGGGGIDRGTKGGNTKQLIVYLITYIRFHIFNNM